MTTQDNHVAALREALIQRLRDAPQLLRTRSMPLADFIPLIQQAADALSQPPAPEQASGYALAMAVLQSDLYHKLDDLERSECDAMLSASPAAPVAAKPEQQAQAGEPEVVAYAGNNGIINPTTRGYDVLHVGAELITLQSHREAIAKRDAALVACVDLLTRYRNETPLGHQPHMIAHEADAAITQANEALGRKEGE